MLHPLLFMADVIAIVADGTATWLRTDVIAPYILVEQPSVTASNKCGRWYSHLCDWQMLLPWWQMVMATVGMVLYQGRCYNLVGRCYCQGSYFIFSSVVLIRTSSHTWGRWYLPMFLLRDGLLTLIYIDSLISLERPCSSLPTMLKLLIVVEWPLMLLWSYIGEGAFRCSLNLSPNVLAVPPMYSSSHSNMSQLYL